MGSALPLRPRVLSSKAQCVSKRCEDAARTLRETHTGATETPAWVALSAFMDYVAPLDKGQGHYQEARLATNADKTTEPLNIRLLEHY